MRWRRVLPWLALGLMACGEREPIVVDMGTPEPPPPEPVALEDTDNDGALDRFERIVGSSPTRHDRACFQETYRVDLNLQERSDRVDFVITVDTSGSMFQEIPRVRRGLHEYFTSLLANPDADIKVILIAEEGDGSNRLALCIRELFGGRCGDLPGAAPQRSERVVHYDRRVASSDTMDVMLETMHEPDPMGRAPEGWYGELRSGATPVFLNITDDRSAMDALEFEKSMRARDTHEMLFDDQGRRYVWHAIVGVQGDGAFLRADEPVQERKCASAAALGREYQKLSRLTGGLRFSVCNIVDYSAVFSAVGAEALEGGEIPCTMLLPPPGESTILTSQMALQLTQEGRDPRVLTKVSQEERCGEGDYYVSGGVQSRAVRLCPRLCAALKQEREAELLIGARCITSGCQQTLTHLACEP